MPKAHGKSGKAFWAPLKTTIKAYAKQQAMRCKLAHGKSGKTFLAPRKTTIKAYARQ
jgi:hypothetical protein